MDLKASVTIEGKTVTFTLPDNVYDAFVTCAAAKKVSLEVFICMALGAGIARLFPNFASQYAKRKKK